jgi:hypothetical protein
LAVFFAAFLAAFFAIIRSPKKEREDN